MSKRVKEVSFNPDETATVNMLLQDEIMRLAESRDWFDRNNVEMPDREKHNRKIENLLSMRNRITCLLIEGAGVNGSKYVLRHDSGKDS